LSSCASSHRAALWLSRGSPWSTCELPARRARSVLHPPPETRHGQSGRAGRVVGPPRVEKDERSRRIADRSRRRTSSPMRTSGIATGVLLSQRPLGSGIRPSESAAFGLAGFDDGFVSALWRRRRAQRPRRRSGRTLPRAGSHRAVLPRPALPKTVCELQAEQQEPECHHGPTPATSTTRKIFHIACQSTIGVARRP
jgi:hypothetical protein